MNRAAEMMMAISRELSLAGRPFNAGAPRSARHILPSSTSPDEDKDEPERSPLISLTNSRVGQELGVDAKMAGLAARHWRNLGGAPA
jgi:hypothetical protein